MNRFFVIAFFASYSISTPASAALYLSKLEGYVKSGTHTLRPYSNYFSPITINASGQRLFVFIDPNSMFGNRMSVSGSPVGGSVNQAELQWYEENILDDRYMFSGSIYDSNGNDGGILEISGVFRNNELLSWYGIVRMGGQAHEADMRWDTIVNVSSFAYVPEPKSWAMMISGFCLIGGAMRRRNKIAVNFG